jgi:hypothetical protein
LYIDYARRLEFEQEPDYDYLRHLFYSAMDKNNFEFDDEFDWMNLEDFRNSFSSTTKKKPQKAPKEEIKNYFEDDPYNVKINLCKNNKENFDVENIKPNTNDFVLKQTTKEKEIFNVKENK